MEVVLQAEEKMVVEAEEEMVVEAEEKMFMEAEDEMVIEVREVLIQEGEVLSSGTPPNAIAEGRLSNDDVYARYEVMYEQLLHNHRH